MTRSVRVELGLEEYSFAAGRTARAEAGQPLRPRDGVRLVQRLHAGQLHKLRSLVTATGRRSLGWNKDLRDPLAELVASGHIEVRRLEAQVHRPSGKIPEPIELTPPEPVANEIVEVHGVMIELVDADGNPVPGEPFRIKLPDGTTETSTLDEEGKAHITGIERAGNCKVCFYERDAAVWARV
ncbi:hypothetical protein ENSA5_25450 [Enhygromyxa salina]|uniref:Carboxypeptidase regulatory-like domain-containing protein n=1 Tax=Enhygromyxa salina TaxID=215803 RepID=A0A2S9YAS2_9BACT|nr:Ig-like domain-containing protein [Enhygromyxa salina]PRQ02210.1 hypothetical protein ENSA5_25450 [Enhygromyxa salina]